jgi:hypothetical protein
VNLAQGVVYVGAVALPIVFTCGCDEPLLERQTVTELRVLGARAEAAAEPERAELLPGEEARLRWLLAADQATTFSARIEFCQATPAKFGEASCAAEPFAQASANSSSSEDLEFSFRVPAAFRDGDEWLARLAVCEQGEPRLPANAAARCSEGSVLEASYRATVASDQANHNPELADDRLRLGKALWVGEELQVPGAACNDGLPSLALGKSAQVTFTLLGDDRESLEGKAATDYGAEREALVFAHFFSESGLARPYSQIESEQEPAAFEVELTPSAEGLSRDTVADFYLVVRDDRGGADWLRRQLCVTDP